MQTQFQKMNTTIVNTWQLVPFIGVQVWKFDCPKEAFEYAEKEYAPYGYNTAFFSTDIKTLFITTLNENK